MKNMPICRAYKTTTIKKCLRINKDQKNMKKIFSSWK